MNLFGLRVAVIMTKGHILLLYAALDEGVM